MECGYVSDLFSQVVEMKYSVELWLYQQYTSLTTDFMYTEACNKNPRYHNKVYFLHHSNKLLISKQAFVT